MTTSEKAKRIRVPTKLWAKTLPNAVLVSKEIHSELHLLLLAREPFWVVIDSWVDNFGLLLLQSLTPSLGQ